MNPTTTRTAPTVAAEHKTTQSPVSAGHKTAQLRPNVDERQGREHSVRCTQCRSMETFDISGVCGQCRGGSLDDSDRIAGRSWP